ncbi:MAG: sugar phosphate isomerase/epimerase [Planctomycetota bacterium]|nr:sugar phosphate isomerase/epimerase [Planctomycetota bacterium]
MAKKVAETGVSAVQLHLDPLRTGAWSTSATVEALAGVGAVVVSGMMEMEAEDYSSLESICETGGVRPDKHWEENLRAAHGNAAVAKELGLELVSLHAGFLPHDPADPERPKLISRLRELDKAFAAAGIRLAFETGQEDAATLLGVLEEIGSDNIGVNFDPANMILYAMGDPVDSFERLAPHVMQVHIKDATKTLTPGTWGAEVPVGTGEVDWDGFFRVISAKALDVGMMIEREAGEDRVGDIKVARALIESKTGAQA